MKVRGLWWLVFKRWARKNKLTVIDLFAMTFSICFGICMKYGGIAMGEMPLSVRAAFYLFLCWLLLLPVRWVWRRGRSA